MAVSIFNSLIFGNIDSADYGIYITGESVYDAPERAVEMVKVPGRNGAIALDLGRWENIEVSYPAGCFGDNQSDFATRISNFRNAIVSQTGYQRLTDTYNPNEYRLGVYASGLDVKPASMGRAGEFTITFDCKPQRFLTSGETETTVSSGDTLTNPTQYASGPLLEIEGYGEIHLQDDVVVLEDTPIGEVQLAGVGVIPDNWIVRFDSDNLDLLNTNDDIILQPGTMLTTGLAMITTRSDDMVTALTMTVSASDVQCHIANQTVWGRGRVMQVILDEPIVCTKETIVTKTITISVNATYRISGTTATYSGTMTIDCKFGKNIFGEHWLRCENELSPAPPTGVAKANPSGASRNGEIVGVSTKTIVGDLPVFIDLDLGEAYLITDGIPVSLNKYVSLGSDLPTLAPGENEITYDNTITSLKIVPRWWRL